jgi:rhodanese-related sulfurtransferase
MAAQDVLRMSPQELRARMMHGQETVIVDVRTEDALSVHPYQIPGTRWLPLASVVQQADTLSRDQTIVIY